jgi:hypothetical protein
MSATIWPIVEPRMIGDGDCGAVSGIRIGKGNRSTRYTIVPIVVFVCNSTDHIPLSVTFVCIHDCYNLHCLPFYL